MSLLTRVIASESKVFLSKTALLLLKVLLSVMFSYNIFFVLIVSFSFLLTCFWNIYSSDHSFPWRLYLLFVHTGDLFTLKPQPYKDIFWFMTNFFWCLYRLTFLFCDYILTENLRSVFRNQSNIYDGTFCDKTYELLIIDVCKI